MYLGSVDKNVTSRGHIEELHCLLKHLLHAEGHTEEIMANMARRGEDANVLKFSKVLDSIRNLRQDTFKSCYDCGEEEFKVNHAQSGCTRCQADLQTNSGIGECPSCLIL